MFTFNEIEEIYDQINQKIEMQDEDIPLETKECIDQLIEGTEINKKEIIDLMEKFTIQYFYTSKIKFKRIKCILNYIYLYRNNIQNFNKNILNLKNAMTLINPYIHKYSHLLDEYEHEYINQIRAVNFFKKQGYQLNVKNGELKCDSFIKLITNEIDKKIKMLGINFTLRLIKLIPKIEDKFYHFPDSSQKPLPPFGFLINMAVKHISEPEIKDVNKANKIWEEILETSILFVCLYRIQNYGLKSQVDLTYADRNMLVNLIHMQVYRDQIFKIDQYDPNSILNYIEFISQKYNDNVIKIIQKIYKEVNEINNKRLHIKIDLILKNIYLEFEENEVKRVIKYLTNTNPNNGFFTLNDYSKKNYTLKPFFEFGQNVVYLNNTLFCVGFYHTVMQRLTEIGVTSSDLGYTLEEFFDASLQESNVNVILGEKKYSVTPHQRKELNINAHELESDGVLFNDEEIFFMEIKKRNLNKDSIGGDIYSILEDLSVSLIHSQTQANKHLRYLNMNGVINFTSTTSIELNNRKISKLSISSLDYGGLHSLQYVQQILISFYDSNFEIDERNIQFEKSINFINKKLKNHTIEIKNSINENLMKHRPQDYMNCFFFNIFQLLYLINISKENKSDLIKEINITRNIRFDQTDFYFTNHYIRNLKKEH